MAKPSSTEKSRSVLEEKDAPEAEPETGSSTKPDQTSDSQPPGHGRNGAAAFESARKLETGHRQLKSCDRLPDGVTAPRRGVAGEPG